MPYPRQGLIYKLSIDGLTYIGSTVRTMEQRFSQHKCGYDRWLKGNKQYLSSYKLFEKGEPQVEILEKLYCLTRNVLLHREYHYITTLECVNIQSKGWYIDYSKHPELCPYKLESFNDLPEHVKEAKRAMFRKMIFEEPLKKFIRSHMLNLEERYKREKLLKRWINSHYLYRDQIRSNVFKLYRIVPYILTTKAIDARKKLLKQWINRHYIYMEERLKACGLIYYHWKLPRLHLLTQSRLENGVLVCR